MKTLILTILVALPSILYSQFYLSAGAVQRTVPEISITPIIEIGNNEHSFVTGVSQTSGTKFANINVGYAYRYKSFQAGIYTQISNTGKDDFTLFTKINYKRHGFVIGYSFNVEKKLQSNNFQIGYMFDICH